jgi:hypothetical protein
MTMTRARARSAAIARTRRLKAAALVGTVALAGSVALAPGASAESQTLTFFQQSGPAHFFNVAGKPINLDPPKTLPKAGDRFDEVDLDYVGNSKQHAKRWTASDHLACTFTNPATATCDVQIAIGGSMLISNSVTFHFNGPANAAIAINDGTGAYSGVHGSFTDVDLPHSQNAILTIRVS